jgi:hypothetical protein
VVPTPERHRQLNPGKEDPPARVTSTRALSPFVDLGCGERFLIDEHHRRWTAPSANGPCLWRRKRARRFKWGLTAF